MDNNEIYSQLAIIVGEKNILTDADSKFTYGKDKTQNYQPNPLAIVFPQNELQVKLLIEWANKTKVPLVPSGGRTGYSGGAVAILHEVIVAFDKMNKILSYNEKEKTIKCQPGVITKQIQDFAREKNMYYPVDFSSSGSSQIGGNIATNAGGIKVIRYGLTRNWVCGLNVVTGNGDILHLTNGLIKNATGYDIRHLFIGSEGTLGLITEATLKLTSLPLDTNVVLFSINNKKDILEILSLFINKLNITAFEFFSEEALNHVIINSQRRHPFQKKSPFYILLEYESSTDSDEYLVSITGKSINSHLINDAIIGQSSRQNQDIWFFRENISISISKYFPYKYDISVTPSKIPNFIEDADKILNKTHDSFEVIWFGHIGDGNLHLNILKPPHMKAEHFFKICEENANLIYSLVQSYEGSISAEHGVGLLKKKFLHYSISQNEMEYMRAIKKIFDKNNILNPGKIFNLS